MFWSWLCSQLSTCMFDYHHGVCFRPAIEEPIDDWENLGDDDDITQQPKPQTKNISCPSSGKSGSSRNSTENLNNHTEERSLPADEVENWDDIPDAVDDDAGCYNAVLGDNSGGLSAEQVAEQARKRVSGSGSDDVDSNRVNVSEDNSQCLSDSGKW